MTPPAEPSYAGHRFPAEVISHAVWLYFRFPLSLRHVDDLLAARGVTVSHETVRQWALKFGQTFANRIRRRLPRAGDKWHLDEVEATIAGEKHWLWRAVDRDGLVLDVLVRNRRDEAAAKRLPRKLPRERCRAPRVMVTDKLASYGAAKKEIMPGVEHRGHKGLNDRAENSHRPTRRRERQMKRFESPGHARRFLSVHDQIGDLFHLRRHRLPAERYRAARTQAFRTWAEVTGAARIAWLSVRPAQGAGIGAPTAVQLDDAVARQCTTRAAARRVVRRPHARCEIVADVQVQIRARTTVGDPAVDDISL